MITEDYISFEIAKLLREKGFDGECDYLYADGELIRAKECACNWNNGEALFADYKNECSAPTLQMAVKYLEEVYRILVVADYEYECTSTSWYFKIYRLGENGKPERVPVEGVYYDKDGVEHKHITCCRDFKRSYKDYSTRKEAIEDGIKYCFEKFI